MKAWINDLWYGRKKRVESVPGQNAKEAKMYRPENWVNPHDLSGEKYIGLLDKHYAFEAGADAMLEALKHRVGSRRNKGNSGWLVFIPDIA